jgi:hypothetical protein
MEQVLLIMWLLGEEEDQVVQTRMQVVAEVEQVGIVKEYYL